MALRVRVFMLCLVTPNKQKNKNHMFLLQTRTHTCITHAHTPTHMHQPRCTVSRFHTLVFVVLFLLCSRVLPVRYTHTCHQALCAMLSVFTGSHGYTYTHTHNTHATHTSPRAITLRAHTHTHHVHTRAMRTQHIAHRVMHSVTRSRGAASGRVAPVQRCHARPRPKKLATWHACCGVSRLLPLKRAQ